MFAPAAFLFFIVYLISFMILMLSSDWIIVWFSLEINMMSFLLMIYSSDSVINIESCLKYFFIQSLGSAMLLVMFYTTDYYFPYLVIFILSYKLGAGFFFYWFPSVCSGISWTSCLILMSFQKIIPLMLMTMMISWVIWIMLLASLLFGAWGSMNQIDLKRLMAFSSIHHIGWMMVCMVIDNQMWLLYLIMYLFMIFPVIYIFYKMNSKNLLELNHWNKKESFIFCMFSMAGMPPFLGFFLKWVVFYKLTVFNYVMFMFLIFMSVLMFYIYIRIIYNIIMSMGESLSWDIKDKWMHSYFYDVFNLVSLNIIIIALLYSLK